MTWNAPIYLYLWLAGIAGGAYFAAFLAERFAGITDRPLLRPAIYIGIPAAVVGVVLLIFELGNPLRFWRLFTQFDVTSPMSLGTWILLLWCGVGILMLILSWYQNRTVEGSSDGILALNGFLGWVELVLSILLIAYTGVLLAVSSIPLWASTALLPSLFVASAISTGVAMVILAALVGRSVPAKTMGRLVEADAIVIVIELIVLIIYAIWLGNSGMAGAGTALGILTTGALALPFWLGVVVLALLIPLGLELMNWGKEAGSKGYVGAAVASSICVLLGGLVLRLVITLGGQI
ncbi:NrfD/PsrC family molybdoenzyme membrane anchor subunit [Chloroflexota bacterium]